MDRQLAGIILSAIIVAFVAGSLGWVIYNKSPAGQRRKIRRERGRGW